MRSESNPRMQESGREATPMFDPSRTRWSQQPPSTSLQLAREIASATRLPVPVVPAVPIASLDSKNWIRLAVASWMRTECGSHTVA
jgi:hypothetical protein